MWRVGCGERTANEHASTERQTYDFRLEAIRMATFSIGANQTVKRLSAFEGAER